VCDGRDARPLLRDRRSQGIGGGVPAAARRPADQDEVRQDGTTTAELLRLHEWLSQAACTHGGMESTSVYWRPVFNQLEGSFDVVLANAQHIKAVPGRKTDVKDCEWIANLLAHGLIRASFIPPPAIRDLRHLTRHRKSLVRDRVKTTNRVHKLLETANIKLATVVADALGVSGRAMLTALVAGETDPDRLVDLTRGRLKATRAELRDALHVRVTDHHRFMIQLHLSQVEAASSRAQVGPGSETFPSRYAPRPSSISEPRG
jgi:transposase